MDNVQDSIVEDPPLDLRESRKRKREGILIIFLTVLFLSLMAAEFHLTKVSSSLPFVNSIFFFGLLNVNIVILIGLFWLIFRNIGKLFIERRRNVLGARLKSKLVVAFLGFSIIPTLVLFTISAMYINSSFDKWFSLKIQNTLQASLEITGTYYRNTEKTAMHFAEHVATGVGTHFSSTRSSDQSATIKWIGHFLGQQRELLALDSVEFYSSSLDQRLIAQRPFAEEVSPHFPRLSMDLLDRAFGGEHVSTVQHIGAGDLIRCLVPVRHSIGPAVAGVISVNAYIPIELRNKVDEIASVFDDYKDTNPLKYPMKTTYSVILIMITLVILFVAIWIGLYMARELTVPVERLVEGVKAVGGGNLDISILASGHDEIAVLVESFNKMTCDLRDNRQRLVEAGADLEKRRLQLEAVLANIGTGVIAVDNCGRITTFNRAVARLLRLPPETVIGRVYSEVLQGEAAPMIEVIDRAISASLRGESGSSEAGQWNFRSGDDVSVLAAVATSLRQGDSTWGVVIVIDDMTHLIKGQREMAWREVARRIAHEIKNPLTPIKLSAQRLQRRLGGTRGRDGALLNECTETIIKHTDELKEMVNEFSNFARFPEASPAPHNLNEVVEEVVALYEQAHPDLQIQTEYETKVPTFDFDRDQIKRVMINLFDNGIAALSLLPAESTKKMRVATHYNKQLQMAVIEVEDNGPGMTEDIKARVFEPYFSTKREGTGLGLSIVKRIINDHDGFIRVRSAPGEGTLFLIEIPTKVRQAHRDGEIFGASEMNRTSV